MSSGRRTLVADAKVHLVVPGSFAFAMKLERGACVMERLSSESVHDGYLHVIGDLGEIDVPIWLVRRSLTQEK